ncbi:hypothetical protein RM532_00510 [Salinisphaera sp. W335]|uniref:Uncharacterized protein n=1 Tax=Spectribacter hydrogenoxidans TaxID=3075608 RepID=A0ABU3BVW4_9GAMM|nr:hypothetical protein [Salinisphaera sp. W335]MDT0633428.1 hypothetical protein [Salinisphaera sp. W335]
MDWPAGPAWAVAGAGRGAPGLGVGLAPLANAGHRQLDGAVVLFRRQIGQRLLRGQLDVDAQSVGEAPGVGQQVAIGVGNGLEVDVAAEVMILAQAAGHLDQLRHGVVGGADHPGAQEQPLDIVALVEVQRQTYHFCHRETRALHVRGIAIDAVMAFVDAEVGQQDFQQRDATAVRGVGVADARAFRRSHAAPVGGVAGGGPAGCAGSVVLGGIRQDFEFLQKLHDCMFVYLYVAGNRYAHGRLG